MLNAFLSVVRDPQIRVAAITVFCLGFPMAATIPYHSIIGIDQLGLSTGQFAALMVAMGLFGTLGNVVIGNFSDHARDRKQAVLVSFAVGAVGFGMFALFPSIWTFLVCLLVVMPVSSSAFAQLFATIRVTTQSMEPSEAAAINSVVRAIFAMAWIVVPGLVGAYVAISGQVSDSFGIGALALTGCFLLYWWAGPSNANTDKPTVGRWASLRDAVALIFGANVFRRIVALAMIGAAHPVNMTIMPLVVIGIPGGTTRDVGLLAGLVAAMEIPFMLLGAALVRRWGIVPVILAGGAIYGLYLAGLSSATAVWQIYFLTLLSALGAAAILSLFLSFLQDLLPDRPGLGTSLNSVQQLLARALGAAIMAGVGSFYGLSGAALVGTGLVLCGCVTLMLVERNSSAKASAN
jgi:predicted MFS family arabinose efflux permease